MRPAPRYILALGALIVSTAVTTTHTHPIASCPNSSCPPSLAARDQTALDPPVIIHLHPCTRLTTRAACVEKPSCVWRDPLHENSDGELTRCTSRADVMSTRERPHFSHPTVSPHTRTPPFPTHEPVVSTTDMSIVASTRNVHPASTPTTSATTTPPNGTHANNTLSHSDDKRSQGAGTIAQEVALVVGFGLMATVAVWMYRRADRPREPVRRATIYENELFEEPSI
eukprot:m.197903 g.197903  ORF g.197903 m.197903 type:complete len:227 (+) comp20267_c0_seq1:480-1160(+)